MQNVFRCASTEYISGYLVNDSVPDCFDGRDEISYFYERQFQKIHQDSCADGTDIPCFPGDHRCFPVYKLCLFELYEDLGLGFLKNCRTGRHIENCTDFTCSYHFKCHEYYCVPWSYTCNGRVDCPLADDEKECENRLCKNLFKCRSSTICIHFNGVCDNEIDCLHGDDELICDLPKCLNDCNCLLYAITCDSIDTVSFKGGLYLYIFLHNSTIKMDFLNKLRKPKVLKLTDNNLKVFCPHSSTTKHVSLLSIDLSSNMVSFHHNEARCFIWAPHLTSLNLSINAVRTIANNLFFNLSKLYFLDISFNPVFLLTRHALDPLQNLKVLSILQNHLLQIEEVLNFPKLKLVLTYDFRICCMVLNAKCTSKIIWPFQCGELLGGPLMREWLWFISCTILFLNILATCSTIIKLVRLSKSKTYNISLLVLNIADSLTGFHLLTIAIADHYYGKAYIANDVEWRKGFFCNTISSVLIVSNFVSMFALCFIAASRMLIVQKPIDSLVMRTTYVSRVMFIVVFIIFLIIGINVGLNMLDGKMMQPLPLCIPYGNAKKENIFITLMYGILQIVATLMLTLFHIALIICLKKADRNALEIGILQKKFNLKVLLQVLMISISNISYWLPSSYLMYSCLVFREYSIQFLFLVAMVQSPINSIVNPCLLNIKLRFKRFKRIWAIIYH